MAIRKYTPELLETLTQHTAYLDYSEQILGLQNELNDFINLAKQQSATSHQKAQKKAEIEKKSAETSKKLTYQMSELLHSFTAALLARKEEEFANFSQQIGDIYKAALVGNVMGSDPPSTELADNLRSLINSENFPQQYKEDLTFIIDSITTSPHNKKCAQYALAEIKSVIESTQAHANEIISRHLPTAVTIKKLIEELSDEFYIGKFIASFKSFKCIDEANREKLAAIETQLTKLALHCSNCSDLQSLIFKWRDELANLKETAAANPTQDNLSKLGEQLTELQHSLETGAYFQEAKKTILSYLINLQKQVKDGLNKDGKSIYELAHRAIANPQEQIFQLLQKYRTEQPEIESWLENYIDGYSKRQSLSAILVVGEISLAKIRERYKPIKSELKEYDVSYNILNNACIDEDFTTQINNEAFAESTPLIESLTNKLLFCLRITVPNRKQIFLENLSKCLETEEVQQNEPPTALLLFKQALRNAITEKHLETLKQSNYSLEKICELFSAEKKVTALLLTSEAKEWFNTAKEAINAFEQCKLELDTKKIATQLGSS